MRTHSPPLPLGLDLGAPGGLSGDGVADLAFGGGCLFNGPVPAGSLTGDGHEGLLLGASSWNGPAHGDEGALFAFPNEGE